MEIRKKQRVERLVQKEINELFRLQTQKMGQSVIISVNIIRISPDLSVAKIFLSIYPSNKVKEIMQNVEQNKKTLRYDLGLRIGKQVKRIPELSFFIDNSLDYIKNIDRLLNLDEKV